MEDAGIKKMGIMATAAPKWKSFRHHLPGLHGSQQTWQWLGRRQTGMVPNVMEICFIIVQYFLIRPVLISTVLKVLTLLPETTRLDKLFHIGLLQHYM